MIPPENMVRELLSVIGYAQQTLALRPDDAGKVQKYLASERVRIQGQVNELQDNLDILARVVIY